MTRFLCMLVLFLISCQNPRQDAVEGASLPTRLPNTQGSSPVQTQEVKAQSFDYIIQTQGQIQTHQRSTLQFRRQGRLAKVHVRNGQSVPAGYILAELDQRDAQLALQRAEQAIILKKSDYQDLLLRQKIDYQKEEEIPANLRQTFRIQSGLAEAELSLQEAKNKMEDGVLRAPFAGVIADLKGKAYNTLAVGEAFCVLYNPNTLYLEGEVIEGEIPRLRQEQAAKVYPLASEQSYPARLSQINPMVNEKGMVQIRLALSQSKDLWPGMNAEAQIIIPQKQALVVPKEALVIRSGRKVVFTAEDNLAKWNYVETGLENASEIEIIEGLVAGQQVIISNNLQLDHDSPIRVEKRKSRGP